MRHMENMPTDSVDLVLTDFPFGEGNDEQACVNEMLRVGRNQIIFAAKWIWPTLPMTDALVVVRTPFDVLVGWTQPGHGRSLFIDVGDITVDESGWRLNDPDYHGPAFYTRRLIKSVVVDLIERYSWPGDVVMDPFCGTGTVPIAAHECGRLAIGIERKVKWFDYVTRAIAHG